VAATFSLRLKGKPIPINATSTLVFDTDLQPTLGVTAGSALAMAVAASGGVLPYTYKWKKGSAVISGQETATFNKASRGDAGTYTCEVTDSGTPEQVITSATCTVTVN
jgi:hypothetical protein